MHRDKLKSLILITVKNFDNVQRSEFKEIAKKYTKITMYIFLKLVYKINLKNFAFL